MKGQKAVNQKVFAVLILMIATLAGLAYVAGEILAYALPANSDASKESVRLRNSLIAEVGERGDFVWAPDAAPVDFVRETAPAPADIAAISQSVLAEVTTASAFEKGVAIARGLKAADGPRTPILSDTRTTYRLITERGFGYCSDYTQVFNALALAAGLEVREWGMSFDRYSGEGHAFNEIFDPALGKWVFIDSYWSFFVRDARSGKPLSAMEFREHLLTGAPADAVEIVPIVPAHFGFKDQQAALDYYRRGADLLYLYAGNGIFTYEANDLVATVGSVSRGLEQAVAILVGVHPKIWVIPSDTNQAAIASLFELRRTFFLTVALGVVLGLALLVEIALLFRFYSRGNRVGRRQQPSSVAGPG